MIRERLNKVILKLKQILGAVQNSRVYNKLIGIIKSAGLKIKILLRYGVGRYKLLNHRVRVVIVIVIVSILSLPFTLPPTLRAIKAPELVYAFPSPQATEVPLDSKIQITFNKRVAKLIAEKSFIISPEIKGSFEWQNDYTLIFTPQDKLAKGQTYSYKFSLPIPQQFGLPFADSSVTTFETVGGLRVLSYAPAETAEEKTTPIVVVFDRPVIDISTYDEELAKDSPITITPAIGGKGTWLGSSAYKFSPTEAYKDATTYNVELKPTVTAIDGETFLTSYSWAFASNYPELLIVTPAAASKNVTLGTPLILTFNQPVDTTSLKDALTITDSGGQSQSFTIAQNYKSKNSYFVTVSGGLRKGTNYHVALKTGLKPQQGDLTSVSAKNWYFSTVTDPIVKSTYPIDGSNDVEELYSASIYFSTKMDINSIKAGLTINPKPDAFKVTDCGDYCSDESYYINLSGKFKAETSYTISLSKTIRSVYGYNMQSDYLYQFRTAPIKPSMGISANDSYFLAYSTNLNPRVVVNTINVPNLNYSLTKLSIDEFSKLYRLKYDYQYARSVCGDNYNCMNWQNYTPVGEKISGWQQNPKQNRNEKVQTIQKLTQQSGSKLAPGLYFLQIEAQEVGLVDNAVVIISDSSLTLKENGKQAFVWAVNQDTAQPLQGKVVKLYKSDGMLLKEGKTNTDGVFQTDTNHGETDLFATLEDGEDFSIVTSNFDLGISRYDFGDYGYNGDDSEFKLYGYTDLPLYRPGETVLFKGLLKSAQGNNYQSVVAQPVTVSIVNPQGATVYSNNFTTNGDGAYSGEYATAEQIPSGYYTLTLNYQSKYYYRYDFQVEEYRKPEFFLELTPDKESYTGGQTNYVTINTSYYFGAPIVGRSVNYTIKTRDTSFVWEKNRYFDFEDLPYLNYYWDMYSPANDYQSGEKVSEGSGITDADGNLRVLLPTTTIKSSAQKLVVEAMVEDLNNQAVAGSREITMHPANFYIGLKPKNYVYSSNEDTEIEVVTVGHDGVEVGNKTIRTKIYKRTWSVVKEKNPDTGDYHFSSKPTDRLVKEKEVKTGEAGYTSLTFRPEEGGIYRIVAKSADANGNEVASATSVWVAGDGYETLRANNDRINIITDKAEYQVGETAKVFADSPYKDVTKSLITLEQDGVLSYFLTETGGTSRAFEVKIGRELFPNAYLSVLAPKAGKDVSSPAEFKIGYAPIKVKDDSKQLEVSIKTDKQVYAPRDKVVLEIITKTKAGSPVSADLSLAATDKAVWDMSEQVPANIFDYYYSKKPLGVSTANLLTISVDRVNISVDKGSKGGGGGQSQEFFETIRTKFLNTAYWLPSIKTNASGYAKVEFDLPDNLTTWKIEGKAHTNAGQFGQGETKTISTKDYILRSFLPKFFSTGDEAKIGAIFINKSNQTREISISLEGAGFELKNSNVLIQTIKPNEQKKALFDALVTSTDSATIKVSAKYNGQILDAIETTIPVKNHYAKQASAVFGEIKSASTEKLSIPDTVVPSLSRIDVSIFPNPILQSLSSYNYLHSYTYNCTEQVSGRLLAGLSLYNIEKAYKKDVVFTFSQKLLADRIGQEIQTITSRQLYDGGWTWWEANTGRTDIMSDPMITAYAYDVLKQAKFAGFTVPDAIITKARNYLISQQNILTVDKNLLTYLLYVVGKDYTNNYAVENLLNNKRALRLEAKTYLADYLYRLGGVQNEQRADTLKNEILAMAKTSDTLVNWEEPTKSYYFYGSDISTTASVVKLLTKYDHNHPYIDKALMYISQKKQNDNYWVSTKTTAKVLESAAARLVDQRNQNYANKFKVFLDMAEVLTGEYTKDNLFDTASKTLSVKELQQNNYSNLKFEKSGTGTLFYQIMYKYFLKDRYYKPTENGLGLVRDFIDDTGKKVDLSKLKEKDMFWVKLTLVVPSTRNNVLIEDYLPAGLESINMNLRGSKILAGSKPKKLTTQQNYWWYTDYARTEYKDDVAAFFAGTLNSGVYEYSYKARATTPGIYIYPPASAYEMYNPNIFGNSAGLEVVVSTE